MNLTRLALRNISGSAFRSWVVGLCAFLVALFALSTTLIMQGAESSLRLALGRLGADIVVVPQGAEARVETALLMGIPTDVWMPMGNLQKIASIPGVQVASPQLFLSTLHGASCCSVSDMFLVAFDPATDFTIQPWLKQKIGGGLKLGEAVGGAYVFTPEDSHDIETYGYALNMKVNLEATGTGLDQSLFFTFDTARDIARVSVTKAVAPLEIPDNSISAVLIKLAPGANLNEVAASILQQVPGVTPIESPNMFQSYREQMTGLLHTVLLMTGVILTLSVAMIALVFSMAAFERRRELGVLRALGATRSFVFRSLLTEAGFLALVGGGIGVVMAALATSLFRRFIITSIGIPFLFPSLPSLILLILGGILLALMSVTAAAVLPAYKISHTDPAIAMRE